MLGEQTDPTVQRLSDITIRHARLGDQLAIISIVHAAHLNPISLPWWRFLVAEKAGKVIGVGQIQAHFDGTREARSLAVRPEYRGHGVGESIDKALVGNEPGVVYCLCRLGMEKYHVSHGWHRVAASEISLYFRLVMAWKAVLNRLLSRFGRSSPEIVILRWSENEQSESVLTSQVKI